MWDIKQRKMKYYVFCKVISWWRKLSRTKLIGSIRSKESWRRPCYKVTFEQKCETRVGGREIARERVIRTGDKKLPRPVLCAWLVHVRSSPGLVWLARLWVPGSMKGDRSGREHRIAILPGGHTVHLGSPAVWKGKQERDTIRLTMWEEPLCLMPGNASSLGTFERMGWQDGLMVWMDWWAGHRRGLTKARMGLPFPETGNAFSEMNTFWSRYRQHNAN